MVEHRIMCAGRVRKGEWIHRARSGGRRRGPHKGMTVRDVTMMQKWPCVGAGRTPRTHP